MDIDQRTLMALRTGLKFGCWLWAIWDHGNLVVGVLKQPLENVYKRIDAGEYDAALKDTWLAEGEKEYDKEKRDC